MLYINKEEKEALGLPLSFGDVREDGYIFRHYYRNKPDGNVLEFWNSPDTWKKMDARKAADKKRHSKQMRKIIRRYKTMYGCVFCGYKKHPDAIHFDHIDPSTKKREISTMWGYSKEAIKEEMKKCRLLCANCHAEHTAKQMETGVI